MCNPQEQNQDDGIDLRYLFAAFWKSRLLILATTVFFAISGLSYALLAPQEWSSTAMVIAPTPQQVQQLKLQLVNIKELLRFVNINTKNLTKADPQIDNLSRRFSEDKLFNDFIQAFNSFDNKCEFLETNGYVPEAHKKSSDSRQRFFEKVAKKITASKKKIETFYTLSFGADNAPEAKKRLSAYINFLQAKEEVMKNQQLNSEMAYSSHSLLIMHQTQRAETLKHLQEEIARTEFSLRITKTAGIESPVENLSNQAIFPIDLGAKALSEKLKILKEIENPEIINDALAEIRLRLESLQALPKEKISFYSYNFLQSPKEPLNRDKPKRSLVVVLATLAGMMFGAMIVLFREHIL